MDKKTSDSVLKKGDRVRFRRVVDPDDDKIVMELLEDPDGGRVLVKSLIWESLNPTRVLPTSELIKDANTKDVMKIGDTVKFSKPANDDEVKARFILVTEPNIMGRVKIQLVADMNFKHSFSELVHESEIEKA